MTACLQGIRVLDLSRILAGPTCTQLLGDLGADVIKIEKPHEGDDTRKWGPPYVQDQDGNNTTESAYYLSINRNKRSVAVALDEPDGQALIRDLLKHCDILVENFKVGGLAKYGLSYDQLKAEFPSLIYCSITGYGQTGPKAQQAGYDFAIQGMGGIMSLTGDPSGEPVKVGVAIADVMTGMHATVAILAALHYRTQTGKGQHIDLALLDTQVSWLVNEGSNYLTSGKMPVRRGNAHPNIVPYQVFATSDGYFILAVGNDSQFAKFCTIAQRPDLPSNPDFATNDARVRNRTALIDVLTPIIQQQPKDFWISQLEAVGVPCAPINTLDQVFNDPQILSRDMVVTMSHPSSGKDIKVIGNPEKFSETPVTYRLPPPVLGEHTTDVLQELLNLSDTAMNDLRTKGIIQ